MLGKSKNISCYSSIAQTNLLQHAQQKTLLQGRQYTCIACWIRYSILCSILVAPILCLPPTTNLMFMEHEGQLFENHPKFFLLATVLVFHNLLDKKCKKVLTLWKSATSYITQVLSLQITYILMLLLLSLSFSTILLKNVCAWSCKYHL